MAGTLMRPFVQRRFLGLVFLCATLAALIGGHAHLARSLRHMATLTGWLLLGICLFLTAYNARKKLPFLPLGNSRTWLQIHAYVGYFSAGLFLVHIGWRWPSGWFENTLALLFTAVAASGAFGLFWSRLVPRRLTACGDEVVYERVPIVRRQIAEQAEQLALDSVLSTQSAAIADFYHLHLAGYFVDRGSLWHHWIGSHRTSRRLLDKLDDLQRFLNPDQKAVLDALMALVRRKEGVDEQYALQLSLRLWLFIHIPLTYGMLAFTAFHVVLVFGFSSGVGFH